MKLVVFELDGRLYALALSAVESVYYSVEITPLPGAPEIVSGAINVGGEVVPVVDVRKRLGLPARETRVEDRLVIASTAKRKIAFFADAAPGILERNCGEIIPPDRIVPGLKYLEGVATLPDGLIVIQDLDRFLSIEEERALAAALGAR